MVLTLLTLACSSGDEATPATTTRRPVDATTTTTVPERPPSTTTTAFDPASVEGQVEAAYLKSWDVYANAVYHLELDEKAFAEVYAGEALDLRRAEIMRREAQSRPAHVRIDHDYDIVSGADVTTANVIDRFVNHQVLIDPVTKRPTEEDPNELLLVNFKLSLIDGRWKVTFIQKVTS